MSESLHLNSVEELRRDLTQAVHAGKPSEVAELKQPWKERWAYVAPQRWERVIARYHKHLIAADATKVCTTSDKAQVRWGSHIYSINK